MILLGWIQHTAAQELGVDGQPLNLDKYVQCSTGVTLNPVILQGKRFYDAVTGEYFPVKGLAYYPRPNNGTDDMVQYNSNDFFTDEWEDLWMQDIAYFEQLGINTIRIYAVDPSKNHDKFMCRLQQAGIYVMVGLLAECENCAIGPDLPPSCYPIQLKERGQFIINVFSIYSNTLVFSAGNEVTLYTEDRQVEINAPCQKKFLRDMRSYTDTCSQVPNTILPRRIPIGMVNWDSLREVQSRYFICRTDPSDDMENAEWYGMNIYQHCDPAAQTVDDLAGWEALRDDFASLNHPIPILVAEYGCEEPFPEIDGFEAQRNWLQVDALYRQDYVDVFAGGVAFEYSAEKYIVDQDPRGHPWPYFQFMKINYGLGYYSPVDCDHITIPCEYVPYPEFDILATKLGNVDNGFVPSINNAATTDDIAFARSLPTCPGGIAPPSAFVWPSDDEPDLECYVLATNAPTTTPVDTPPQETPVAPTEVPTPATGDEDEPSVAPIVQEPSVPTLKPVIEVVLPTLSPAGESAPSSGVVHKNMLLIGGFVIFGVLLNFV